MRDKTVWRILQFWIYFFWRPLGGVLRFSKSFDPGTWQLYKKIRGKKTPVDFIVLVSNRAFWLGSSFCDSTVGNSYKMKIPSVFGFNVDTRHKEGVDRSMFVPSSLRVFFLVLRTPQISILLKLPKAHSMLKIRNASMAVTWVSEKLISWVISFLFFFSQTSLFAQEHSWVGWNMSSYQSSHILSTKDNMVRIKTTHSLKLRCVED